MTFKEYLQEYNITHDENIESIKKTANMIAHSIEDEEFRFKKKYASRADRHLGTGWDSIYQKIAMTYLSSKLTVDDMVKMYKLSTPEASRLLDFLNKNYYWYRDEKTWEH